jgi:hypothetical protein
MNSHIDFHSIGKCFRVMVLDHGEVKEFDSPQTLMNNSNSLFYAMAKDANLISWLWLGQKRYIFYMISRLLMYNEWWW